MLQTETRFFKIAAKLLAVTVANLSVPLGFANAVNDIAKALERPVAKVETPRKSRVLTGQEMKEKFGKQASPSQGQIPCPR